MQPAWMAAADAWEPCFNDAIRSLEEVVLPLTHMLRMVGQASAPTAEHQAFRRREAMYIGRVIDLVTILVEAQSFENAWERVVLYVDRVQQETSGSDEDSIGE